MSVLLDILNLPKHPNRCCPCFFQPVLRVHGSKRGYHTQKKWHVSHTYSQAVRTVLNHSAMQNTGGVALTFGTLAKIPTVSGVQIIMSLLVMEVAAMNSA